MIKYGTIAKLGTGAHKGMARVFFQELDVNSDKPSEGIESPWMPVMQGFTLGAKAFRMPRLGTLVGCMMDEDWETGMILGARYNTQDTAPDVPDKTDYLEFEDGTQISYDPEAHLLKVDVKGDVQALATGAVMAQAGTTATVKAPSIVLDGPVHVTGTLLVDGKATLGAGADVTGAVTQTGNFTLTGAFTATGEITSGAIPLTTHKHTGVTTGSGTSAGPVP